MKKTISIICFVLSVILFLYFLIISIDFIVTLMNYSVLETSGDVLSGMITIFTYTGALLITSILGLPFAIVSAKCFANKIIRICSNIEIVLFSIGIIFSLFQLFIK